MNSEKLQQIAFELILSSGDARTLAVSYTHLTAADE